MCEKFLEDKINTQLEEFDLWFDPETDIVYDENDDFYCKCSLEEIDSFINDLKTM